MNRAIGVASFNAWTFAVLCGASVCLLPYQFTVAGILITLVLGAVAYLEFRGKKQLAQLNVAGCRLLGWNQVLLLTAIVIYCTWSIVWGYLYPSPMSQMLAEAQQEHPQIMSMYSKEDLELLEELAEEYAHAWPLVIASVYGSVIAASLIVQGWNAWYNFSRARWVRECRDEESAANAGSQT